MSDHQTTATRVILEEAAALAQLAQNIPSSFTNLVDCIISFKGRIILTGIGKSGYIAHKIAASFASTGTAALYIHPAEASHGDLGMITEQDLVMMLSNSGETKELFDIINYCKRFAIKIVAMTMNPTSTLATNSDFLLPIPKIREASTVIAPTTSALMMLALGDALTVAVQEAKGFSKDDFRLYHPGGKIGANLLKVKDLMRSDDQLPLVYENTAFTDTIITITQKSLGCAIVINTQYNLIGIITDGDLRRHLKDMTSLKCAYDVMTANPKYILPTQLATEALYIMNNNSITAIPVVEQGILVGVIHIHDLLRAGIS
ncbi:KpsF/GutQ family sugar-phosphate isomerase [Candidatus Trichorickettsia mobilis]|uniref:KpsF/GutQ family sugar-phosphate isomerase n=1 Tax=Candidatus Trichorickettsia mobilis TaxID=1346319 RepID=UPI0029308EB3|nr:KpsF/GutQ family sugar-phosphate isomerase [Candidatus Trichorickettsia mobilis]